MIEGPCKRIMAFTDAQIPYFFRQGAIIPYNPNNVMSVTERPEKLILNVVAGADSESTLYEDGGDNADYATHCANTTLSQVASGNSVTYTISARKGSVADIAQSRAYELRIYNSAQPLSATVDGQPVSVVYDDATTCTTVEVPIADCSQERVIRVDYQHVTAVNNINNHNAKVGYDATKKCLVGTFPDNRKDVSMLVSNGMGKTMLNSAYHNISSFSADLSMLQPQLYISKVVADGETFVTKFIKQ